METDRVDEVRERNELAEVISTYIPLKQAGRNFKALCPFHQEKTPSFTVSPDKQLWHCFGCNVGGDVFSFVQRIENLSFIEAAQQLAKRVGVEWHRSTGERRVESERQKLIRINQFAAKLYQRILWDSATGQKARDYLKERGVSVKTAQTFGLGYAPDAWDSLTKRSSAKQLNALDVHQAGLSIRTEDGDRFYDRFRDRLMFPIQNVQGEIIGFGGRSLGGDDAKYINTPETPLFSKRSALYGFPQAANKLKERDVAIVVEGYTDCISLYQHGFENAVATMGTALSLDGIRMLKRYTPNLRIAFDSDSAGMAAVLRGVSMFVEQDMWARIVILPGGSDPDEYLRKSGGEEFKKALDGAKTIAEYRLARFVESDRGAMPSAESVRAAVGLLREIQDRVERDECLRRLAGFWAGGEISRTRSLEEALRAEMGRNRRRAVAPRSEAKADPVTESLASSGKLPVGVQKAESELIAGLLQDEALAPEIVARFAPDEFITSSYRDLARIAASLLENGSFDTLSEVVARIDDEILRTEATGCMLADIVCLQVKGGVESRVNVLREYVMRQQEKKLQAQVVNELESGTIDNTRPEFIELLQLQHRLRGPSSETVTS